MPNLTADQISMIQEYETFELEDLYNLIGNTLSQSPNPQLIEKYTLGEPNVYKRGELIVADVRKKICSARAGLNKVISENKEVLEPVEWVATIADWILALPLAGIPPWSVAVALGKLCDRTLSKLCGN